MNKLKYMFMIFTLLFTQFMALIFIYKPCKLSIMFIDKILNNTQYKTLQISIFYMYTLNSEEPDVYAI